MPALLAVQAISRIINIFKLANYVGNGASRMRLGSYDGAWYTEGNGTKVVTVSQILGELGQFFVHQDNN